MEVLAAGLHVRFERRSVVAFLPVLARLAGVRLVGSSARRLVGSSRGFVPGLHPDLSTAHGELGGPSAAAHRAKREDFTVAGSQRAQTTHDVCVALPAMILHGE
ncbi:MAG TPA: hypothetical protein VH165_08440 [Kofleriaceae bacterium]|nr:hypothetical protein [Kofleriaceae bacterium]